MLKFFKKVLQKLTGNKGDNDDYILLHVRDDSCGNLMEVRAIKSYDLHRIYEDELPGDYRLKKIVVCNNCYNKVDIEVFFDKKYDIIDRKAEGGRVLAEDEIDESRLEEN